MLSNATISNAFPTFIDWTSIGSPGVAPDADDMNRIAGDLKAFTVGWGVSALTYDNSLVGDNNWHPVQFSTIQWNATPDSDKLSLSLDVGQTGIATQFTIPATGRYWIGGMHRGAVPAGTPVGYWAWHVINSTTGSVLDKDNQAYTPGIEQVLRLGRVHDLAKGTVLQFEHFSNSAGMTLQQDNPRSYINIEFWRRTTP